MKRIIRNMFSTCVITAVVSAVSAVVCAILAGCRLSVGECSMKDFGSDILSSLYCTTNSVR